jgi:hypothetical protein
MHVTSIRGNSIVVARKILVRLSSVSCINAAGTTQEIGVSHRSGGESAMLETPDMFT